MTSIAAVQYLSALFAGVAAVLWFLSAKVDIPATFPIHVVKPESFAGQMIGGPLGGEYAGFGHSNELDTLASALGRQSRFSAWAALAAAVAALLQGIATAIQT
jgi:hypothetical protein